ncbi:MAG: hypothetical protein L3K23_02375 [Thermoplasmata archaeon]|nr:hypothetical protein [Thermoplasmata archaeon]
MRPTSAPLAGEAPPHPVVSSTLVAQGPLDAKALPSSGPAPVLRDRPRTRGAASRWYLLPMSAIVAAATALLVFEFLRAPLPPGVDPGHWLSISYGYVGRPQAPDPADRPFFYSPLLFPFLGGLVLLTGSPPAAATITAAALLVLYGLTVIHLARRFLFSGTLQVLLVGLAVFAGTTFRMLFWGGYPNFLGFIFLNESMIFFLLYARGRQTRDAALFFAAVGATFFAHDLTFFVLLGVLGIATLFLLAFEKLPLRFLVDKRNLIGITALVALVVGYNNLTSHLGISHPNYFFGNPSAYHIDEIGELFVPLGGSPMFLPAGPPVVLGALFTVLLLLAVPVGLLCGLFAVRTRWPDRVDSRLLVASGWLSATATLPAIGYLLKVDTDYERFLYFLPLPFLLLLTLALERAAIRPLLGERRASAPRAASDPPPALQPPRWFRHSRSDAEPLAAAAVALVVFFVFVGVTIPVAQRAETSGAGASHDAAFVAAATWLDRSPTPGNVLTPATDARWTEALANRQAFDNGPVWLLFDPFQIVNSEESYWALNSEYAVSNGQVVLSYSGFSTTLYGQAPMYTANDQGIAFPVFRLLPGAVALNATTPSYSGLYSVLPTPAPALSVDAAPPGHGTIVYATGAGTVTETAAPGAGGSAAVQFQVQPKPGAQVRSLVLELAGPPPTSAMLARDRLLNLSTTPSGLTWVVTGQLGEYPYPAVLTTQVGFSLRPSSERFGGFQGSYGVRAEFPNPNPSQPFTLTITATTDGTSNPTKAFPTAFGTAQFLQSQNIHFLLWPNSSTAPYQVTYYESTFGFQSVYNNPEWVILQV